MTSIAEFEKLLQKSEGLNLEFKAAKNQFSHDKDLPNYCAAMANEGGGRLILGVDNNRNVIGTSAFSGNHQKISNGLFQKLGIRIDVEEIIYQQKRVLFFNIPSHFPGQPVKSNNAYWMRAGESLTVMDEMTLKNILNETLSDFSAKIVEEITINDLDEQAVLNFKSRWANKSKRQEYLEYTNEKILRSAGLLNDKGLNYASLILFGKKEKIDDLLPGDEIIFEWRQQSGKTTHDYRKNWREPFFKIYDEIWETINARNLRFPYQDGLFQLEVYAYSEKPVREALLNAVAHRDYTIVGQSIFIKANPEVFSVESPGGLPQGITLDNILFKSVWRNRTIAEVFEKAGLVERSGQGMDDIFRKTITEGKGLPDFSGTDMYTVKLNIPSKVKDTNFILFLEKINKEHQISFSFEEIYELERIREYQKVSSPEFKKEFLDMGIIEKIGKTKDAEYILSHKYYEHVKRPGKYTRLTGVPRDKQKDYILKHLEKNKKGTMKDFQDIFPELKQMDISNMLRELKDEGKIVHSGSRKTGFWFLK